MRFGDKLFFAMTAILTIIFTVFGSWMLSSYFQNLLDRVVDQTGTESRMYQYLFEMTYQTVEEYGSEYALNKAINNASDNVEKEGVICFVLDQEEAFLYGSANRNMVNSFASDYTDIILSVRKELDPQKTFVYGIRQAKDKYYLVHISKSVVGDNTWYLGIIRDLSDIYQERTALMNQYRLALCILLFSGGICIYGMTRLMTRPLSNLGRVAVKVAAGNYEERSHYKGQDEIGEVAASFNLMTDRLIEQMHEKEREAKLQEDFTAAFAHELKTPLTSIIGYADMLGTIPLSEEERQEAYYYIFNQGKRLDSMSRKLLELVSVEKTPLSEKPVSTKILEENLRATMRPVFKQKNIKGKISLEKAVLRGDHELLLSLFYNILDNAVKAVSSGGFILCKGQKNDRGYEFKIIDNGRGIPKEELERITEAFYMVDKSRSRKEGGAGIGMALCKRIVELHNGTLKINSNPGEGTVVRVWLPNEKIQSEKIQTEKI
ncbi:MAG: HAMP domain-containing histidine kinase [Lachnospiraceae bacterium]|nr:HAMP domain-containing histidine kinase [Lachnospiraceae bacterium]